jgi:hypothetical protein
MKIFNLTRLVLISTFLLNSNFAQAEENIKIIEADGTEATVEVETETTTTTRIDPNSSQGMRQNKSMIATGQVAGLGPVGLFTTGASFGFYLDQNTIVDLSYQRNSVNFNQSDIGASYKIYSETLGAHYKHFLKNTLYVKSGPNYRKIDYTYTSYYTNNILEEYSHFRGSAMTATFAFGNHWQWDHFTMGCDWFGVAIPLSTSIDAEKTSGAFSSNVRRVSDDERKYLRETSLFFTQFYLGASF